jgi:hypothetical protein
MDQETHVMSYARNLMLTQQSGDEAGDTKSAKAHFHHISHSSAFITQLIACRLNVHDYRLKNRKQSQGASQLYRQNIQHFIQARKNEKSTVIHRA